MKDVKKQTVVLRRDVSPNPNAQVRRRRKKRKNLSLYYTMIFLFAVGVTALLSVTVFFNITEFEVSGNTLYSTEQIISASGAKIGNNMMRMNTSRLEENITNTLVYVESVNVKRSLPSTIKIEIVQAEQSACIQNGASYCVISKKGKIVETALTSPKESLPIIVGFELESDVLNTVCKSADEAKEDIVFDILSICDEIGFEKLSEINITDRTNIVLRYNNKVDIKLGSSIDMEYKLGYIKGIIDGDEITSTFEGTIVYYSPTVGASVIKKGDELVTRPPDSSDDGSSDGSSDSSANSSQ